MPLSRKVPKGSEISDAASNLFAAGVDAYRANDNQMAKILVGVAERLSGDGNDPVGPKKGRDPDRSS